MTSLGDLTAGLAFSPASFGGFLDGHNAELSSFGSLSSSFLTHLDLPTPLVDFLCQKHIQPGNEDLSKSLERHRQQQAGTLPHHPASASESPFSQSDHELFHGCQQVLTMLSTSPQQALPHVRSHMLPLLALPSPAGASAFLHLWKRAFEIKGKEQAGYSDSYETQVTVQAAVAAARLLRNVVAGEDQLQAIAFQRMGAGMLSLLRLGSSLAFASDPELQPLTRSLVQLLSNLVTLNKPLQKALFHHLRLKPHITLSDHEASERVNVVQSLLASPDPGTVESVQILLLNCVKSSPTNSSGLATSLGGRKLLGQLLTLFEALSEEEEADKQHHDGSENDDQEEDETEDFGVGDLQIDESAGPDQPNSSSSSKSSTPTTSRTTSQSKIHTKKAAETSAKKARQARHDAQAASIRVGYAIFAHLFEYGLFKHMYRNLSPRRIQAPEEVVDVDPLVTTEQTLLLKTADAWINAGAKHHSMHDESSVDQFRRLPYEMARLSTFLRDTLTQSQQTQTPDRRIVGVHQALVLVLEVLIQLGMIGCEGLEADEQFKGECEELLRLMRSSAEEGSEGLDVVREIVDTLRVSNEFAPPISPFTSASNGTASLPTGHTSTSTGRNVANGTHDPSPLRLDNLNRTLIQLLGVLAFQHSTTSLPQSFKEDRTPADFEAERAQITSVQDRTRESGGLFTVISLTQVDEKNPYIREHALFTLRYLLQGNLKSQELVRQLTPVQG